MGKEKETAINIIEKNNEEIFKLMAQIEHLKSINSVLANTFELPAKINKFQTAEAIDAAADRLSAVMQQMFLNESFLEAITINDLVFTIMRKQSVFEFGCENPASSIPVSFLCPMGELKEKLTLWLKSL